MCSTQTLKQGGGRIVSTLLQCTLPPNNVPKPYSFYSRVNGLQNATITTSGVLVKIKVPLQAMKTHRGCGCKGPHKHSHGTRKS